MAGKINAVIIDDEKKIVASLKNLLAYHCPEVNVLDAAHSVQEGLEIIVRTQPQLVFLDIAMPDGNGFDLLKNTAYKDFEVIFITAYDEYALKAFEFSAVHYLLKPFRAEELKEAIERYNKINASSNLQKKISLLHQNLQKKDKRIVLPTQNELQVVQLNDIVYCESSRNYTIFHLENQREVIVTKSLNFYETLLVDFGFFRIHLRYLINLKYLKCYVKGRGGYIILKNGKELDVSSRKKQAFLVELDQYYNEVF